MNPEFKKHLWLEFSLHRLIATPILIGLALALLLLVENITGQLPLLLNDLSLTGFYVFSCLGGAYAVASAMASEHNNKSWDWVRLGSRSAWEITWGKILGASSYMWYGAVWFLLIYLALPAFYDLPISESIRIKKLVLYILMAMFLLALSLGGTLSISEQTGGKRTNRNFGISATLLALMLTSMLTNIEKVKTITWYGQEFVGLNFLIMWGGIFVFWTWLGCYRAMRLQLQFRNGSFIWVLFNATLVIFINGFLYREIDKHSHSEIISVIGFGIAILLFYIGLFASPPAIRSINTLLSYIKSRSWIDVEKMLPTWTISLVISIIWLVSILITSSHQYSLSIPCGIFLLAIRDATIFIGFSYGKRYHRAAAALLVYLIFLYAVFPMFILQIFKNNPDSRWLWLQPFWPVDQPYGPAILLLEVALVYYWTRHRIINQHQLLAGKPSPKLPG